ncbi:hypothetical protein DESC_780082 [Desulfosarcina cetonica]|nr:hypothetical protein DESC_780082 [Desulfosarcina cetonica]
MKRTDTPDTMDCFFRQVLYWVPNAVPLWFPIGLAMTAQLLLDSVFDHRYTTGKTSSVRCAV